ncbi:aminotransferase DegT [Aliidiomarina minuta]|uniref:Aminotransferase DegT n=1 Tax=Aliidiomarina minuta TaxID=880057 RepID=A0A432W836_9GAMM|nr:DegT/DnrJ/EryC1/StrS family aminotransferase [Aliidiomarina minuta]RUO26277.1 aminotransferase DegT [Aliidiomarina minuta]
MIPVTKPYLPERAKLDKYIDGIYERNWLTNSGPLYHQLTDRLKDYLGVEHLLLVSNGTLALQIAYRALGLGNDMTSNALTTPFTFVATASSLKWEGISPKFVDIDPDTWCMKPSAIEAQIDKQTKIIVPVHVFGNACDVESIQYIADRHQLKVVYDAAHAFGVNYKNESLLKWGDAATLSFHATKVFHSIEGGAIVFKHKADYERAKSLINFGITGPDEIGALGINAKLNEFQAAMGLCVMDELESNFAERERVWRRYHEAISAELSTQIKLQIGHSDATNNAAYFPVVFESESKALSVLEGMKKQGIQLRRYFYPSLDMVPELSNSRNCLTSQNIAKRILCLPVYASLTESEQNFVISELLRLVNEH